MRVLVTGGAGYLGTSVVNALSERSDVSDIVIYDNLSRGNRNFFLGGPGNGQPVRFIQGDMLDSAKLPRVLEGIDVVMHLAARVKTPFADEATHAMDQVNHWGTAELSYALERSDVRRVVYTSSTAVYGHNDQAADVSDLPSPVTAYGVSKLAGESMLRRLGDEMSICIVRCGNVYGFNRSMRFDAVVNRMAFDARFSGRVMIEGSGEQLRSFIHVAQAAAVLTDLACSDCGGDTWNLVEHTRSVNEIAETLESIYPDLERMWVQPNLHVRSLSVRTDQRLAARFNGNHSDFQADARDMDAHFAFATGVVA